METNDITAEKIEKLYEYLKEKYTKKIENIEKNISEKESFLSELEDTKKEDIIIEIEGLKKYREEFEEKLNNIEELNTFSETLKEFEEKILERENQIKEIEKEEKGIDLNDEDAPSNLYDLSERKKEIEESIERVNWQRNQNLGMILSSYEEELINMPNNYRYASAINGLEASLENANNIKEITLHKMENLKQIITDKGIVISENNLYDLSSLKGNDKKIAQNYNELSSQITEFDYDIEYYNIQINNLNKLDDIEKQIDEAQKLENSENIETLNSERKELIEKVKQIQNHYSNKEKLQEENNLIEEQQEIQKSEEQKSEKNKRPQNYHSSSNKLTSNYNEKLQNLNEEFNEKQDKINEILTMFDFNGFDINEEYLYEENEFLVGLKEKYDVLTEELIAIENDKNYLESLGILDEIEEVKNIENLIEEFDNEIEKIENQIDDYEKILGNEELSEDSEEKNKAREELQKLNKQKSEKISVKNETIDKKDILYKEINQKINNKSKVKEKSGNEKSNNSKQEGYWVLPQNNTVPEQSNDINNEEQIKTQETKALTITTGNIIEDYSKADNKIKNSLYLAGEFNNLLEDLKSARGLGKITKEQKSLLKDAIENHGNSISKELEGLSPEAFTKFVKDIYGDDTEKLNKYLTKKVVDNEDIINYGIFADLYNIDKGVIKNLNSIEKMNPKSVELINDLFNKYYEKIQNGEIEENGSLDLQFKKMILNPIKFGIISKYNRDIQKPFLFRLNKIKMLFSKKAKEENEKLDIITLNINKNESKPKRKISRADKLGLGDSVEKNPPAIDKSKEQDAKSKDVHTQEL